MADQRWNYQLKEVIVLFETIDAIEPEVFWNRLEEKVSIFPEARRLSYERLSENQPAFFKALRDLARQEHVDDRTRRKLYWRLARYYDCVFKWVEEGEPGKNDEKVVIHS